MGQGGKPADAWPWPCAVEGFIACLLFCLHAQRYRPILHGMHFHKSIRFISTPLVLLIFYFNFLKFNNIVLFSLFIFKIKVNVKQVMLVFHLQE